MARGGGGAVSERVYEDRYVAFVDILAFRALVKKSAGDEKIAEQAVKVALDELRARLAQTDRTALEAQLSAIDAKLERALDMAVELPDLAVVKAKLRELRGEREKVVGELARTARALPTLEELEPLVRARLRDLRATLEADVGLGRLALCSARTGCASTRMAGSRARRPSGPKRYGPRGEPRSP